jgi:hypothetical protein
MLGRTLTLDVAILFFHPLLPLRPSLLAVALEASLQPQVARRLDPDRVGEVRPEGLSRRGDALQDDERGRFDQERLPFFAAPTSGAVAGRLSRGEWLEGALE